MKEFYWDAAKNERLIRERGVSFEEVLISIGKDGLLDIIERPNIQRYKNQKMFIVKIKDYAYQIPFVEEDNKIFLKTIIPSRKATRKYLEGFQNEED